jgi:hypothetical protein
MEATVITTRPLGKGGLAPSSFHVKRNDEGAWVPINSYSARASSVCKSTPVVIGAFLEMSWDCAHPLTLSLADFAAFYQAISIQLGEFGCSG